MSKSRLRKIPFCDGKAESFRVYISKIEAYAEFVGMRDALDPILMKNCPTHLEFAALDIMKSNNQGLIELYMAK